MKKAGYYFWLISGIFGFLLLFLLNFLYIFCALGLLSAGLIIFPSALLGVIGAVAVITDIGLPVLAALGLGFMFVGGGMCLGTAFVCPASISLMHRFAKAMEWRRRRLYDEEA